MFNFRSQTVTVDFLGQETKIGKREGSEVCVKGAAQTRMPSFTVDKILWGQQILEQLAACKRKNKSINVKYISYQFSF